MGRIVQGYFADPGTKYSREIISLQEKVNKLSEKLDEVADQKDEAEKREQTLEQELSRSELTLSFWKRTFSNLLLMAVTELIVLYFVSEHGEGDNLFQKITNNWAWIALGFGANALVYPFILGRERLRLLKWWKGEIDGAEPPS